MYLLYEINTRIWLRELSEQQNRTITLESIPDSELKKLSDRRFTHIWLLGVWQTGPTGRMMSRSRSEWVREFHKDLPGCSVADICGSPYAVQEYSVHRDFGGNEALKILRGKLNGFGLKLLLDFVPNHTALDHSWAWTNPEYYIHGDQLDLVKEPQNYVQLQSKYGEVVFAHGRDPYFPGWPDTLQLNYRHPGLRAAMLDELLKISHLCDGVRCDMAMLLLPDVIKRTWGEKSNPPAGLPPIDQSFWIDSIRSVKEYERDFLFMAEVYWDLECELIQQGFDYTYDKRLYDNLKKCDVEEVRHHLRADLSLQNSAVRFLENHDELRAAAVFPPHIHAGAALITYLSPGMKFFHDGQLTGRKKRVPVHLGRRATEDTDAEISKLYEELISLLQSYGKLSSWQLLNCRKAWEGNPTDWNFVCFCFNDQNSVTHLVAINFGACQAQCYVALPFNTLKGCSIKLQDELAQIEYVRDTESLIHQGLYLDMPAWGRHVFTLK